MARRNKHDLGNPKVAVAVFRDWCLKVGIIPEHASIEDLDRFGKFLAGYDYSYDEIQNCKYVIFDNL